MERVRAPGCQQACRSVVWRRLACAAHGGWKGVGGDAFGICGIVNGFAVSLTAFATTCATTFAARGL